MLKSLTAALATIMTTLAVAIAIITHGADTTQQKNAVVVPVPPEEFTPYAKRPLPNIVLHYRVKNIGSGRNDEISLLVPNPRLPQFRPPPGYMGAFGLAANAHHQIAGRLYKVNSGAWLQILDHGFLFSHGVLYDLGALPGFQISEALAINDQSMIAGYSQGESMNGGTPAHAVCWVGRKIRDLGIGRALSINAAGNMAGDSSSGQEEAPPLWTAHPEDYDAYRDGAHSQATLWAHGCRYDLNTCIPPGSGWILTDATGINNKGQIVGHGLFHGKTRAFLLTPNKRNKA